MEPKRSIDLPVDVGQKLCVFGAYLSFVIGLFDHDDVGEPGRKPDFSDKVFLEELVPTEPHALP